MNINGLLGILAILYVALVVWMVVKKPPKLWDMAKIKFFREKMGEKGAIIFFLVFAAIILGLGIWAFASV